MSFKHPAPALRHPSISLRMADGGDVSPWSIKGMANRVKGALTDTPEQAAQKAALADYKARAAAERAGPAPAAAPAPQTAAPMGSQSVIDRRMAAAGLQDGGEVPGEGTGDKIPALYEPGEFVVSNAMLKARPSLRAELHELREDVLEDQGKTVEEADAKAVRYADAKTDNSDSGADSDTAERNPKVSLRALDGFDVTERPMTSADSRLFAKNPGPGNPNVPVGGSADAQAFRAARAPTTPTAPATPSVAATPSTPYEAGRATGTSLRNALPSRPTAAAGLAAGTAMASSADSQQTPTENYYRRLDMDPSDRSLGKDLLARGVGVMSDFGASLLDTPVSVANGVSRALGGKGDLTLPGGNFGDILRRQDGEGGTPTDSVGAPVANSPTVQQPAAAPKPSLRAAAPAAEAAPTPAGNVNVTRQANGNLSFSGKDVTGDVTYGGPAGNSLRANPIGVVPAMDRRTVDAALNNPNGTRWSSNDNAIMAANIRDGVDPYRGTSRAQNTGDPAMQQMEALASSPVGTPGRNGAIRAMIALKGDQTARRGQDLNYDASMTGTRASMENNRLRMGFDNAWKEREFGAGRDDKAFERKQSTDKAWNDHAEQMFRTNVDGKDVPDTAKIALYTRSVDETIGKMIPDLLKSGDPAKIAYANKLSKEGRGALDDEDRANFTKWFETQRIHAGSYGSINPLAASGTPSQDLRAYANPKNGNGIFQERTDFGNGISIPNVNLDYGPNANRILPNWGTPSSLRN